MGKYSIFKCSNPKCNEQFKLHEIYYSGGLNDYGWIEIKCKKCGSIQKINVKNPSEYQYGTFPNAEIINSHEYEVGEERDYSIHPECVSVIEDEKNDVEWTPLESNPFWQSKSLNELNYTADFKKSKYLIDEEISNFLNYYLAGQYRAELPQKIIVIQHVRRQKVTWAKTVERERDFNANNLYLVNHNKQQEWPDGVYDRNTLLIYLERCLMRWKTLANQVVIVTPFIGFQYKSRKTMENIISLWEFLNDRLDMSKTYFITRTETKNLLKKSQSEIDIPYEILAKWHLMNNLQEVVEKQRIKTKGRFHAKFYAGIFDNHVEVLSGSYNIHTGGGLEQISMRNYPKDIFKNRYMDNLVDNFHYNSFSDEDVLFIEINTREIMNSEILKMSEIIHYIDYPK